MTGRKIATKDCARRRDSIVLRTLKVLKTQAAWRKDFFDKLSLYCLSTIQTVPKKSFHILSEI